MFGYRSCHTLEPLLWDYSAGRLLQTDVLRIEAHLQTCAACRKRAEGYRLLVEGMQARRNSVLPASRADWPELRAQLERAKAAEPQRRPLRQTSLVWCVTTLTVVALCTLFRPGTRVLSKLSGMKDGPTLSNLLPGKASASPPTATGPEGLGLAILSAFGKIQGTGEPRIERRPESENVAAAGEAMVSGQHLQNLSNRYGESAAPCGTIVVRLRERDRPYLSTGATAARHGRRCRSGDKKTVSASFRHELRRRCARRTGTSLCNRNRRSRGAKWRCRVGQTGEADMVIRTCWKVMTALAGLLAATLPRLLAGDIGADAD